MTRRILQVVGGMERGGIQNWLMQLARRLDRGRYRLDFLLHEMRPEPYDGELRHLGCRLLYCPDHRRPWRYAHRFNEIVRANGPYDVVHSHLYDFSGLIVRLAAHHRIPIRIAHSHTDERTLRAQRPLPRRLYSRLMRRWIRHHATVRVAASRKAAEDLFGPDWPSLPATRVVYCGLDLAPFRAPPEPAATVRAALGLPADALVIGHVGQFKPVKNHALLLEIAARAVARDPRVHVLLVGDGPLRPRIEAAARDLSLAGRVVFAGGRDDVPRLMLGAMDVVVFPSLLEGLGLVLVEAQAAGLPCVLSSHLPEEVDVVPALMHRLPLDAPPERWTCAVLAALGHRAAVSRAEAFAAIRASPFNIERSVQAFERLYDGGEPCEPAAPTDGLCFRRAG